MTKKISEEEARAELETKSEKVSSGDVQKVLSRKGDIEAKFEKTGYLNRFINELKLMFSLIQDYWNGVYREVPWMTANNAGLNTRATTLRASRTGGVALRAKAEAAGVNVTATRTKLLTPGVANRTAREVHARSQLETAPPRNVTSAASTGFG